MKNKDLLLEKSWMAQQIAQATGEITADLNAAFEDLEEAIKANKAEFTSQNKNISKLLVEVGALPNKFPTSSNSSQIITKIDDLQTTLNGWQLPANNNSYPLIIGAVSLISNIVTVLIVFLKKGATKEK